MEIVLVSQWRKVGKWKKLEKNGAVTSVKVWFAYIVYLKLAEIVYDKHCVERLFTQETIRTKRCLFMFNFHIKYNT